ncbi:hypothetical protein MXB_2189 [Myxobolus squamalis]|nr:hypothetical protein MXB_2189 [Myxobolus squamalis]
MLIIFRISKSVSQSTLLNVLRKSHFVSTSHHKNKIKENVEACKNIKIVDKNYLESQSSCFKSEKNCIINSQHKNEIKYYGNGK